MLSTVDKDLKMIDGKMCLVQKEYPNWYGIEEIGFIWHGEWADPYIEYNGKQLNSTIPEGSMWERYKEDCEEKGIEANYDEGFSIYMRNNKEMIIEYIELALRA